MSRRYRHALCVYPYRVELGSDQHFPALGIEIIGTLLEAHAESLDVVDLRREESRTVDFIRPDTDLVESCAPFSNIPTQYLISVDGQQKWYGQ